MLLFSLACVCAKEPGGGGDTVEIHYRHPSGGPQQEVLFAAEPHSDKGLSGISVS